MNRLKGPLLSLLGALALAAVLSLVIKEPIALGSEPLVPLAKVGPWSAVSSIIGFGDRVWFVNSVKYRDHNSADVYSYGPKTGELRYERHLFSQDAGHPAAAKGLLYWPFEDARFSSGHGEYMLTNGRDWQWQSLPNPGVLHLHTMRNHRGGLYAGSGGFVAMLHRSDDEGVTWRTLYTHQNAPNSFSRLISLGELGGVLYAGLQTGEGNSVKLLMLRGEQLLPVPGWPAGDSADELVSFRGWLYAMHGGPSDPGLWRTNGRTSHRVAGMLALGLRAIAAGPDALWAVSTDQSGGALWRSSNGNVWRLVQRFSDDEPVDVSVYGGRVYVGAIGADRRGVLYGPSAPALAEPVKEARQLPAAQGAVEFAQVEILNGELAKLDQALNDLGAFDAGGGSLPDLLEPLAAARSADISAALAQRLGRVRRDSRDMRLAGRRVPAADKADWYLLWAIAKSSTGRIPVELLENPFREPRHRSEKYAEPVSGAAWAVAQIGQADRLTLAKLVSRLDRKEDPPFVAGDIVGALVALTGCRFGYDASTWRKWMVSPTPCAAGVVAPQLGLVEIPGGRYRIGESGTEVDEAPRDVEVEPFRIMRYEVTNREFAEFIAANAYVTDPERSGEGYVWTDRWRSLKGANWRRPSGPRSSIRGLDLHPVVQVSARDAAAFCAWRGLRLPSEEEWEAAARGTESRRYPWGNDAPRQSGARRANFGTDACCAPDASDGYARTAPVGSFPLGASPYGIQDMAGNVWEWTTSHYTEAKDVLAIRGGGWGNDAYCLRTSYRHGNPPDIGLDMVGFRCAGQ